MKFTRQSVAGAEEVEDAAEAEAEAEGGAGEAMVKRSQLSPVRPSTEALSIVRKWN